MIELEKVDLAGIVSDIILDYANEFAQKGISPIFVQTDNPVFILGKQKHSKGQYKTFRLIFAGNQQLTPPIF